MRKLIKIKFCFIQALTKNAIYFQLELYKLNRLYYIECFQYTRIHYKNWSERLACAVTDLGVHY